MTEPVLDLLVVDDDDLTAESLQRSLKKISSVFHVVPAEDGQEALDILFGRSMKRIEAVHRSPGSQHAAHERDRFPENPQNRPASPAHPRSGFDHLQREAGPHGEFPSWRRWLHG